MVYLIYGSPCSGKSAYIQKHMRRGDLVCDVDLIYSAISNQPPHDAELYTHNIACQLTDTLREIIRERKGDWHDAYVVSIANTDKKVKKEIERINADKAIFIDTPYEVCIERAKERPLYFQWLIQEWFETRDL